MLNGKLLSILGDSISTYKGISNDETAAARLYDHPYHYRPPFPLRDTYWMRVMERFGMRLCVNNSWSGGNLSGAEDDASGVNRAAYLSRDTGESPDVILVFMGINDLGRGFPCNVFARDYERTLSKIKADHPNALVCCINLPDRTPVLKERTQKFNAAIASAAENAGANFFVADLFRSKLANDIYYMNTMDGLHPDPDGMEIIAEVVIRAFLQYFAKQSP